MPKPFVRWSYDTLNDGEKIFSDALADACQTSLYWFCKWALGMDDLNERVHGPICNFLTRHELGLNGADIKSDWALAKSTYNEEYTVKTGSPYERVTRSRPNVRNRLVLLPRSSFKTSIAAVGYPLWRLIRNPNDGIIIASLTEGFSVGTMNAITQHITQNPKVLHYWTGDGNPLTGKHWVKESPKWTTTEAIVGGRSKLGRDLSLKAVGVRSFHPGSHALCAVVDDPIDREVVESEEYTATVAHFFTDLTPVLDPPALILTIATRWAMFDQMALLQARDNWDVYSRAVYNPDGSLWYPERFSEKRLADLQEEYRNDPSGFHSQYLMRPITDSEKALQLDKVHWVSETGECATCQRELSRKVTRPNRADMRVVVCVDPSDASDGAGAGSWAGWAMGADADKNIWDLGHFKARCDVKKANDEIVAMCRKFKPDVLAIEGTAISRAYIQGTLGRVLADNGIRVAIHEVSHGGEAKQHRILNVKNGLGGCIAMGRLHAREENFALKSEFNTFPSLKHMHDLLDAGTYGWRTINELRLYPTKKEVKATATFTDPVLESEQKMCDREYAESQKKTPKTLYIRQGIRRLVAHA